MLAKKNRLRKKKEFNFVYKKGTAIYSKFFAMYIVSTKFNQPKIGFSVSNKVGNSVVRHLVKRRLSEVIKQNINSLPKNNYVFVAKQGSENLSFEEIKQNILFIFKKANIKNENKE